MRLLKVVAITVALIGLQASPMNADPIVFSGSDSGASAPGPGSTGVAAAFDAAASLIGPESIITFEPPLVATDIPATQSIALGAGVSVTGSGFDIRNTPTCATSVCGGNTTPGGSQWLEVLGVSVTFNFLEPIQYFGAYFGGLQGAGTGQETITFNDGSARIVDIPELNGGFAFVGFTDAGASISSVTVNLFDDIASVDDVRYNDPPIPEPRFLPVLVTGLLGLAGVVRHRKLA